MLPSEAVTGKCRVITRAMGSAFVALLLSAGLTAEAHARATLSISGSSDAALEGAGRVDYTVSLSEPVSRTVLYRVCFSTSTEDDDGMATLDTSGNSDFRAGTDYRIQQNHKRRPQAGNCSSLHMFSSRSSSLSKSTFHIQVNGDTEREDDEQVVATLEILGSSPGAVLGSHEHTHRIYNDDNAGLSLIIEPKNLTIIEGESKTFTVKLSHPPIVNATSVIVSGAEADGSDRSVAWFPSKSDPSLKLSPSRQSYTKLGYDTARPFTVTALDDGGSHDRTITLRLGASQRSYNRGNFHGVTESLVLNIIDAPSPGTVPRVAITAVNGPVGEGGTARFRVTRTGPTDSSMAVRIAVSEKDGDGQQFVSTAAKGNTTILIEKGDSSATLEISILSDSVAEADGEVRVSVRVSDRYTIDSAAGAAVVAVLDDDGPQVVSVTAGSGSVTEGTAATYTVARTGGPTNAALTVRLTVGEDSASGQDFVEGTHEGDKTVSIPQNRSQVTYDVPTVADGTDEPDGEVRVSIRTSGDYTIDSAKREAAVAVQDDDDPPPDTPVAAFASAASSAGEDAGTRNVTVNLDPAPQAEITLRYAVGGTAGSGDYSIANAGSVDVPANAATLDIPVAITDDTNDELAETVILTLSEGTGYLVAESDNVHTLTIEDNDEPQRWEQVVRIAAGTGPVVEGANAEFEVTRSGLATTDLTVRLSVTESSTGVGDFVASGDEGNQEVVIPAGSLSVTYAVPTQEDGADEPDGGVSVTVRNEPGYNRHNRNHSASMAITDDDATQVTLSGSSDDIAENGGTKVLTVNLGRALVSSEALAVPLIFSDLARRGTDYTVTCGTAEGVTCHNLDGAKTRIEFAGPSARSVTLTLTAVDDGIDEGLGERVSVGFGALDATSGTNLSGGATGIGLLTFRIDDDDTTALTVSPLLSGAEFWEGETLEVTVSGIPADYTAVTLATAGSTAVRGTDYRLLRSGGAVLGANDTLSPSGGSVTFKVQALTDSATEGDETVALRLDDPGGTLDEALGTLTLSDGARPVLPPIGATVSKTALVLVEGGSSRSYTVVLTRAPMTGQTVTVTAASGEPGVVQVAGPDGVRGASVVFSFTAADWNAAKTVTVHAQDDADGTDETVNITHAVAGPGDWQGAPASRVRVTVDDDEGTAPSVSITSGQDIEEGGSVRFTVRANPAPPQGLAVRVQVTQDGAYVNPYQAQMGLRFVRISPGSDTANLWVRTEDDGMGEADGMVHARVVALGSGYRLGHPNRASVTVSDNDGGAVTLSVADVREKEGKGYMTFTATLERNGTPVGLDTPVLFRVRTRETTPVSAREGDDYLLHDYRALDQEIRIWPGRKSATFWVRVWDDSHDEGDERFEVVLSEVRGADVGDGVAVGTIRNDDPMPAAWLSRFGRTVAQQALDGIAGRMAAPRIPGVHGTIAGQALGLSTGSRQAFDLDRVGASASGETGPGNDTVVVGGVGFAGSGLPAQSNAARTFGAANDNGPVSGFGSDQTRTMTVQEALLGSSFAATGQPDAQGGSFAFWGRVAQATFDGREGAFALDGEMTTAMLGTDYARDHWLLGVTLLQSTGTGGYDDQDATPPEVCATLPAAVRPELCHGAIREGAGAVETTLTAAVPYAALQASDRLKLWGAAGYGAGEVTLTPETGGPLKTDIAWTMAELGLRGTVFAPPTGSGPTLAVTSDALWARTTSEKVQGGLADSASAVTRLRLGLEGQWPLALDTAGQLTPTLAMGARHDGGDAETGFGVELGGGLAWTVPQWGLALNLEGRTLLTHRDADFQDQGVAAAIAFDPDPATTRGPSLSLRQDWGGAATGGLDALFASDPLAQRPGTTAPAMSRWMAEGAWGFPVFGGRFTGSPHVGLGLAPGTRDYRLGWRLVPDATLSALALDLQVTRRERDAARPAHTVGLELSTQW